MRTRMGRIDDQVRAGVVLVITVVKLHSPRPLHANGQLLCRNRTKLGAFRLMLLEAASQRVASWVDICKVTWSRPVARRVGRENVPHPGRHVSVDYAGFAARAVDC